MIGLYRAIISGNITMKFHCIMLPKNIIVSKLSCDCPEAISKIICRSKKKGNVDYSRSVLQRTQTSGRKIRKKKLPTQTYNKMTFSL